jgi:hypothetical protein
MENIYIALTNADSEYDKTRFRQSIRLSKILKQNQQENSHSRFRPKKSPSCSILMNHMTYTFTSMLHISKKMNRIEADSILIFRHIANQCVRILQQMYFGNNFQIQRIVLC